MSEVYDDNIFVRPDKSADYITSLSIEGEMKFGDPTVVDGNYFDAFYQPTFIGYVRHSDQDTVNENAYGSYQHRFTKLTLGIDQSYVKSQSATISIGNLVVSDTYTTHVDANYNYSDKVSINATASQAFVDYENGSYTNSKEWVLDTYFLYKLDDKFSLGLGPKFGYLDIQDSPNQPYQQLLGHVNYAFSEKTHFSFSGGAEYREFQGGVPSPSLSPVFQFSGSYQPFLFTTLFLNASRQLVPSYNQIGQDYTGTSLSFTVSQAFLQKFSAQFTIGYENDDYEAASAGAGNSARQDDYITISPGLSWNPNQWLVVSAFYKYSQDESTFDAFSFNDNQIGFSLTGVY